MDAPFETRTTSRRLDATRTARRLGCECCNGGDPSRPGLLPLKGLWREAVKKAETVYKHWRPQLRSQLEGVRRCVDWFIAEVEVASRGTRTCQCFKSLLQ